MTVGIEAEAIDMTANERARLLDGRKDWREFDWQDHCGDPGCEHCEGSMIPEGTPGRLTIRERLLRIAIRRT